LYANLRTLILKCLSDPITRFAVEAHNLPYWLLQAEQLRQRIFNAGLVGVWNMKPLVDGKTLLQLLQIPQGPILTKITQEIIEWQLDNPAGVAAQCEAFLLANKDRYHAEAATMKSTKKK
jgi:tRNA nucleotidyltransferase/poly(A) polymerase